METFRLKTEAADRETLAHFRGLFGTLVEQLTECESHEILKAVDQDDEAVLTLTMVLTRQSFGVTLMRMDDKITLLSSRQMIVPQELH